MPDAGWVCAGQHLDAREVLLCRARSLLSFAVDTWQRQERLFPIPSAWQRTVNLLQLKGAQPGQSPAAWSEERESEMRTQY